MTLDKRFNAALANHDQPAALKALDEAARKRTFRQIELDVGVEQSTVRKALMPGSNPRLSTLAAIADALGYQIALIPKDRP